MNEQLTAARHAVAHAQKEYSNATAEMYRALREGSNECVNKAVKEHESAYYRFQEKLAEYRELSAATPEPRATQAKPAILVLIRMSFRQERQADDGPSYDDQVPF